MSSYFDRVEQGMREAVERRAHRRWYMRLFALARAHTPAVGLAALVVAAPAVGAVTNWFGLGAPDRFPRQSATLEQGRALPGTSELLALRIPDPQGGPPWALRLVRTTRGDTCVQLGRVEDGKLGSLGIDDAWNNDHLFHPFPNTSEGDDCGTTDAVGEGFVNVAYTGMVASANPTAGARGPQAGSCQPPLLSLGRLRAVARRHPHPNPPSTRGTCPRGSARIVFIGLLGPDATSITYQASNGSMHTERTSGNDGAYLLVFPMNAATCLRYTQGPTGGYGPCGGTESEGVASPDPIGAVKAITYRDGHTCRLEPSLTLTKRLEALRKTLEAKLKLSRGRPVTVTERLAVRTALLKFLAAHHVSLAAYRDQVHPFCPAVGYVAAKEKRVTSAMVATPISVKIVPKTKWGPRVDISFTARQPVTSSSSWYEDSITTPPGCYSGGSGGQIDLGNVRSGERLHDNEFLSIPACKGVYHGSIGYMQNSGPINQNNSGGGMPGEDGSVVVGRFSFTIQ
jgi:hypothetical protein